MWNIIPAMFVFALVSYAVYERLYLVPTSEEDKDEPIQQPAQSSFNLREANEEFLDLAMRIVGHYNNGADVYRKGGSIIIQYPNGKGWKVNLSTQSELRQPKIIRPADVVKHNGHKHQSVQVSANEEPDWMREAFQH